jgi:hypothetical protein
MPLRVGSLFGLTPVENGLEMMELNSATAEAYWDKMKHMPLL